MRLKILRQPEPPIIECVWLNTNDNIEYIKENGEWIPLHHFHCHHHRHDNYIIIESDNNNQGSSSDINMEEVKMLIREKINKSEADSKYQPKGDYLTEHQSLEGYAKKSDIPDTEEFLSKQEASETYQPKGDYLTEHQNLDDYAKKTDIPSTDGLASKTFVINEINKAQLEGGDNDIDLSIYATKEESDSKYQEKGEYLTEHQHLKTINNIEIPGEGNIDITFESLISDKDVYDDGYNEGYLHKHNLNIQYKEDPDIDVDGDHTVVGAITILNNKLGNIPEPKEEKYKGKITIEDLVNLTDIHEDDTYSLFKEGNDVDGWSKEDVNFQLDTYPAGVFVVRANGEWVVPDKQPDFSNIMKMSDDPVDIYLPIKLDSKSSYHNLYGNGKAGIPLLEVESFRLDEDGIYRPLYFENGRSKSNKSTIVVPYARSFASGESSNMSYEGGALTPADYEKLCNIDKLFKIEDVLVDGESVVQDKIAKIDLSNYVNTFGYQQIRGEKIFYDITSYGVSVARYNFSTRTSSASLSMSDNESTPTFYVSWYNGSTRNDKYLALIDKKGDKNTPIYIGEDGMTKECNMLDYATESWVNNQGFLKQHQSLSGYATQLWVESQGYLTSLEGAVRYDIVQSSLTESQKTRARLNIGASNFSGSWNDLTNKPGVVRYDTTQNLGPSQQYRARLNIGATDFNIQDYDGDLNDLNTYNGIYVVNHRKATNMPTNVVCDATLIVTVGTNILQTFIHENGSEAEIYVRYGNIGSTNFSPWRKIGGNANGAVLYTQQTLQNYQKEQARTNIGAGTVTSIALKMNGRIVNTITSYGTIDLGTVLTQHQDLTGYATQTWVNNQGFLKEVPDTYATKTWVTNQGYTKNNGTVTSVSVMMNGKVKGTVVDQGTINLGTVLTEHQSLSDYATINWVTNNYLPLSGGTVGSKDTAPLKINCNSSSTNTQVGLEFRRNDSPVGSLIVIDGQKRPSWSFNGQAQSIAFLSDLPNLSGYATQDWVLSKLVTKDTKIDDTNPSNVNVPTTKAVVDYMSYYYKTIKCNSSKTFIANELHNVSDIILFGAPDLTQATIILPEGDTNLQGRIIRVAMHSGDSRRCGIKYNDNYLYTNQPNSYVIVSLMWTGTQWVKTVQSLF